MNDKHNDFDNNEDVDLTGMIHQYNEDNELRRKINEMKKQKEMGNSQNAASFDPNDSAFVNPSNESKIPDIKADFDAEKTRVNFSDDSDKTLVIMDRKNKVDAEPVYEDYSYREEKSSSALYKEEYEPEEDIRETIKKKRIEKNEDDIDFENDEKAKKTNKIITYVIIGILAVAVLVGAGFGIKYVFFNGDSEEKIEEKEETNKKDPVKKPETNKKDPDIKDNSAVIKQLESQIATYESQLQQVENDKTSAETSKENARAALNNIATLLTNRNSIEGQMKGIANSEEEAKKAWDNACKVDPASQACTVDAKGQYERYVQLKRSLELADQEYKLESAKDASYQKQITDADAKISELSKKKTELESKIADKETELEKYK